MISSSSALNATGLTSNGSHSSWPLVGICELVGTVTLYVGKQVVEGEIHQGDPCTLSVGRIGLDDLERTVAIDMEEGVLKAMRRGPLHDVLRSCHMISDVSGAGNNWAVGGLNLGNLWSEVSRLHRVSEEVLAAWDEGHIQPEIAAEIPFENAPEAHRMLAERRNLGKVLLIP